MLTPGNLNIDLYAGATFEYVMQVTDPLGTPIDFTGMTARMKARPSYDSSTVLLDLDSTGTEIQLNTPATGYITVNITAATTAQVGVDCSHQVTLIVYDLEIVDGVHVDRLLQGSITVYPEATR